MSDQQSHPLSQTKPFQSGADFQFAYKDTCQHSMQDAFITKDRILGCQDCEDDLRHQEQHQQQSQAVLVSHLVKGTFPWAMDQLLQGKEIYRLSQAEYKTCYGLRDGEVYLRHTVEGGAVDEVFSGIDVTATDWVVEL